MPFIPDLRRRLSRPNGTGDPSPESAPPGHWEQLCGSPHFLAAEIDRGGLIRSANPKLCQMREEPLEDIVGKSLFYLVCAGERNRFSEIVRDIFHGKDSGELVARLVIDHAPKPTILWAILPVRGVDGEVGSAICIGVNLTPHLAEPAPQPAETVDDASARESKALMDEKTARLEAENEVLREELERLQTEIGDVSADRTIPGLLGSMEATLPTLADMERRYVLRVLGNTGGRVSGNRGAAAILGLHPNTLRSRMEKLGIRRLD